MSEAVLLNSGGIDSRVVAALLSRQGWKLRSLHLPFNPNSREASLVAAERTAALYAEDHFVAREPDDFVTRLGESGWIGLPFTGLYVHLVGAMYATKIGVEYVASGIKAEVMTSNYLDDLRSILSRSKLTPSPSFVVPFLSRPELAEIAAAKAVGVDLRGTVSCWSSPPCGSCSKCERRKPWALD